MGVIERFEFADLEGLRIGRFASQLNTTCILYRLGDTVIDTGPPNQWRFVRRFLQEREIERILVTHHHEDHSGNLAAIGRCWGPTLMAPAAGRLPLSRGYEVELYRRIIWGKPLPVETVPLPARLELAGGISLLPIHTPGHSPDLTCFLEPERGWLFSGDLFIATRTRYLRRDENVSQQVISLKRALREDFATLLCSHRGVIEDGRQALERKLEFLVVLCQQAQELERTGRSLGEITRALLGREDRMALVSRWHFSKRNLIASCLTVSPETLRR